MALKKKMKAKFCSLNPFPLIREEGEDYLIVANFVNPLTKPPLIPTISLLIACFYLFPFPFILEILG